MEFIWHVFEFYHIIILVLGLFLGILIGALPGLTPTMGVALMIPFTFSLGAADGLILLGGIYCGSVFGGSIPAILFNVPGAPASVATTFDGYPMAQQGKAGKALELAVISSVAGGLFGMFLLIFFAPFFTKFSLQFGPAETFWIAVFGITVIAAISDGSVGKNLIGGAVGILLSFIGISTVTGTARFTLGFDGLVGGLHIVAVLIGLFAFPQALRLIESLPRREKLMRADASRGKSTLSQSFADVFKRPKSVTIGSGIGALIGIIPGAGGNIASILAYNEAKRFSKDKSRFGKGEAKGVIAAESANNAMVGASLIPLLTLGIPGSPTAAIFLGGLLIHGIWPGRNLFIDNAETAYVFLYSMVAAQFVLLFLGLLMIKYMTRLTSIPAYFMAPVILSFSIIGAYTTQNSVFDIYTVVVIGCLMFLFQKFKFSPAPVALGFILGSIAEEGFLQGLQVGSARGSSFFYFFSGGWNIALFCLVVLTIAISVVQGWKNKEKVTARFSIKKILSAAALCWIAAGSLAALSLLYLNSLVFELRIFPQIILFVLIVLIGAEVIKALQDREAGEITSGERRLSERAVLIVILIVTAVSLLTNVLGYYLQVFILMVSVPLAVYLKKWNGISIKKIFLLAVVFTLILYVVFTLILKVPLPVFPSW